MSASVESRIITIKFDNSSFATKVSATLDLLQRLKESLKFSGSKKGIDDLQNSANRFNLNPMNTAVQGVNAKFLALATVAITALSNIVNKAVDAGSRIVKALTVEPIMDGFREYETNMNSIQTILANTQAAGTNLDQVNAALQELNHYSDQTIYNFSEMAKNIGTFTAAGVDLDTATGSIKGIANLAALSGSNSQQASTAMYQLSQAISSGKVSLMDWNSVVNAGMGGSVFQRALAQTAVAMGKLDGNALKLEGSMKNVKINGESFRDSISAENGASWLSSEVLTATLNQFTGDLSDAELAAQGFTDEQIAAIKATAQTAKSAATEVKTITQLFGTLKESAASGWMQSFQTVLGDFADAKTLLTGVNNALGGFIQRSADARNKVLGDWEAMGGRTAIIESIRNAFNSVVSVINIVKGAFREFFPAVTGEQLATFSKGLQAFTENLQVGGETAANISRTFRGVFALLSIGARIVMGFAGVIGELFGIVGGGGDDLLGATASIGDFLVALEKSDGLMNAFIAFFSTLNKVVRAPFEVLKFLGEAITAFFDGFTDGTSEAVIGGFTRIGDRINPLKDSMAKLQGATEWVIDAFRRFGEYVAPIVEKVAEEFSGLGEAIAEGLGTGSFDKVFDLINTGLLGGIAIMIMKFFNGGMNVDIGGGLFEKIGDSFDALNNSLTAMQTNIQSKTLMNIAIAVGILAASMVALSLIDSAKLTSALTAMAAGFAQLLGAMAVLIKIGGAAGFLQIPLIATAMVSLSTAVLILAGAVTILAQLSWEQLAVGLAGIAGAIGILVGAAVLLSKFAGPGLVAAGAGMLIMANAIAILSGVVLLLSTLSWEELGQGLAGIAAMLGLVVGAMTLMPPNMIASAVGMTILAVALGMIAGVVAIFAAMGIERVMEGLVGVAGALGLIAGAMTLMPPNMLLQAVALTVVAAALGLIAAAVGTMGGMSWEEIGKGMVVLAGSLAILAAGLYLMTGAALGAVALIVAAGALAIIAPVLETLGGLSWEEIGKGLVALAGAFVVIGLAGLVLTPLIPSLLGLGAAITLLGLGMALAGAGVFLFATGFGILAAAFGAGITVIIAGVAGLLGLIPVAMEQLANGILAFAVVISEGGPALLAAFTTILLALLDAIIAIVPKLEEAIGVLLEAILRILVKYIPIIADAGLKILLGLLAAFRDNIYLISTVATDLMIEFINAIADNGPRLADAAGEALIDFLDGLTAAVEKNAPRIKKSTEGLATAIIDGITGGLGSKVGKVADAAKDVAQEALSAAKNLLGIESPSKEFFKIGKFVDEGFAKGMDAYSDKVANSSAAVGKVAVDTVQSAMTSALDKVQTGPRAQLVVTPVIDMDRLNKDVKRWQQLNSGNWGITPAAANGSAQALARRQREIERYRAYKEERAGETKIEFTQNNTSPEALPVAEVYRRTKTAIPLMVSALAKRG